MSWGKTNVSKEKNSSKKNNMCARYVILSYNQELATWFPGPEEILLEENLKRNVLKRNALKTSWNVLKGLEKCLAEWFEENRLKKILKMTFP